MTNQDSFSLIYACTSMSLCLQLSVTLSVCPSVCLSLCLSVTLSICPSVCPSTQCMFPGLWKWLCDAKPTLPESYFITNQHVSTSPLWLLVCAQVLLGHLWFVPEGKTPAMKDSFHIAHEESPGGVDVPTGGHDPLWPMTLSFIEVKVKCFSPSNLWPLGGYSASVFYQCAHATSSTIMCHVQSFSFE